MKSHCCTLQNYPNPNIHTVILSVARDPHETVCTFAMNETALGLTFLKWTKCTFVVKLHQVPGGQGYTVLYLQTCKDLCVVQGTAAGNYASQLLKASCASYAKGLRSLQRSTGPFASHSLCLLCAALSTKTRHFVDKQ